MELSQSSLAFFFAVTFVSGALLGAIYDVSAILPAIFGRIFDLRLNTRLGEIILPIIKRKLKRRVTAFGKLSRALALFFHDLLFMSVAGVTVTLIIYRFNDGIWRAGVLVCLIAGFAIYRVTLRRPILCFAELLRFVLRAILAYVIFFIWSPIMWLIGKLIGMAKRLRASRLEKYIKHYSEKEKKRLLSAACEGSLDGKITFNGEKYARRKKEKSNSDMGNNPAFAGVGNDRGSQSHAAQPDTKRSLKARSRKGGASIPS